MLPLEQQRHFALGGAGACGKSIWRQRHTEGVGWSSPGRKRHAGESGARWIGAGDCCGREVAEVGAERSHLTKCYKNAEREDRWHLTKCYKNTEREERWHLERQQGQACVPRVVGVVWAGGEGFVDGGVF